jgi:hypothetical protein
MLCTGPFTLIRLYAEILASAVPVSAEVLLYQYRYLCPYFSNFISDTIEELWVPCWSTTSPNILLMRQEISLRLQYIYCIGSTVSALSILKGLSHEIGESF